MKRLSYSLLLSVLASLSAVAQDFAYPYLAFTAADGVQTTLSVANLEITFSEGRLIASNADGTTTLALTDLASMAFSSTGEATPVDPIKAESGLAFADDSEFTATLGQEFAGPEIANPNNLALSWASSDDSVATVDADGHVTLVGEGTVTITAAFAGNDEFEAGSASYTIVVSAPEEDAVRQLAAPQPVRVYTVAGIFVGTFDTAVQARGLLPKGLYVVSDGIKNLKMNIR